jgi:hypothetical protein
VFIITACVYLFGLIVYSIFCETDVEPWARATDQAGDISSVSSKINLIKYGYEVDEKNENVVKF